MSIKEELLASADEDGRVHAERALVWAEQHPELELYRKIDWDDNHAAHAHRLSQIRQLIQVHIVYSNSRKRSVVSLKIDRRQGGGYRELRPVLDNATLRRMLLRAAVRPLENWLTPKRNAEKCPLSRPGWPSLATPRGAWRCRAVRCRACHAKPRR